jgi:alpha-beta hydrolase superfamily lysophospholipase
MSNDVAVSIGGVSFAGLLDEQVSQEVTAPQRKKAEGAWSLSIEERRTSCRLDVHLSTVLQWQDHAWKGITKSIGFGGFSMTFVDDIPAMLNQHIMLGLNPDAGHLGTLGVVCGIRGGRNEFIPGQAQPGTTLAVKFVRLSPEDEQVLALLFSDGRVRLREVRLAAALSAQEKEEALVDSGIRQTVVMQKTHSRSRQGSQGPRQERRRHRRIAVGLSTEISLRSHAGDRMLSGAMTKDLTSSGACVSVPAEEVLMGSQLLLRWTKPTRSEGPTDTSIPVPTCSVMGEVMWTRLEPAEITSGAAQVHGRVVSAGVRFLHRTKDTEEAFEQFLAQMEESAEGESADRSVNSEFSECFRPSGPRIVLCHDRPRTEVSAGAPIIVLAPGYGESKRDYVPLAYYLAGNGFHVVRYDNVNHVGESDGVVTQFRLQDMESDLEAVLDHLATHWPDRPIGLVATSLAGRVALKVAGRAPRVQLLVLINGIMDIRHTLQAVHQEDLIGEHMAGVHKGVVNILGLTIDADRWLEHAVQGGYADLATTQQDAERLRTPVVLFHAEHDAWVDPASIHTVEDAIGSYVRHSYVVPGALHRLRKVRERREPSIVR